ncbi:hypothetical protein COU54_03125 [Candidatus Pacearchaeota archaeon CG10_big_fil_rev_8_21_14_0_10_31_24]|nr:MAG: hypothetical protein COU54_03125 [Candidatus Pacearchaeota archaeon CG10_big_fil_rev_8_21_14_0_10_31_24]
MGKGVLFTILFLLIVIPLVSADITIEKKYKGSVILSELENPGVFDLTINNHGETDTFEIYDLVGVPITPRGKFEIKNGTSKTFEVRVFPPKNIRRINGPFIFDYQIKGEKAGITKDQIKLTIVSLEETLSIDQVYLDYDQTTLSFPVHNLQKTYLEDLELNVQSALFDSKQKISLKPYETQNLSIPIDIEKNKILEAGSYFLTAEFKLQGSKVKLENYVSYAEKNDISKAEDIGGTIIKSKTITKQNNGNVPLEDHIEMTGNVITRLFTSHSIEPSNINLQGFAIKYSWDNLLEPGESWSVVSRTNYTLPSILIILLIAIVTFIFIYSRTKLVIRKKVSYVKTKDGQFAVKVSVGVKSRAKVLNVKIIEHIPGATKLYDRFGIRPDKIDHANRRLIWNLQHLRSGEERIFSYIIYSPVKIVGRLELPPTIAVFEHLGKTQQVLSNRTFFES